VAVESSFGQAAATIGQTDRAKGAVASRGGPVATTDQIDLVKVAAANSYGLGIIGPVAAIDLVAKAGPTIDRDVSTIGTSGTVGGRIIGPTSTTIGAIAGITTGTIAITGSMEIGGRIIHATVGAGRRMRIGGDGRPGQL
jgi:hypothetical protein